jgi:hypothetical protein
LSEGCSRRRRHHHTFCNADNESELDEGIRTENRATHMSAVKEGKGLATIEDITMVCLGIFLERRDTSGGMHRDKG